MGLITILNNLVSAIGTISGSITIIDVLEKRYGNTSLELQLYKALNDALRILCEQHSWEYDSTAVASAFHTNQINVQNISDEEQLGKILRVILGVPCLVTPEIDVEWTDCFDRAVALYPALYRYLDRKNNMSNTEEFQAHLVSTLTDMPAFSKLYGREPVIADIYAKLNESEIVCIYADGGVGKTAVASAMMEKVKNSKVKEKSFDYYAWVTSSGNLNKDLTILNIPAAKGLQTDDEKWDVIKNFLQKHSTFLVIDNMDTPPGRADLGLLNTIKGKTKILITSRIAIAEIDGYKLEKMDQNAALVFFYKGYLGKEDNTLEELKLRKDVIYVENIIDVALYNALLIELLSKMARWEYRNKLEELWKAVKDNIFNVSSEFEIENQHSISHGYSENEMKLQDQIRRLYTLSDLSEDRRNIMNFMAHFPAGMCVFDDLLNWAGFGVKDLKWLTERAWIEQTEEGYLLHTMVKGSVWKQDVEFNIWEYRNLIKKLGNTDKYMPVTAGYIEVKKRLDVVSIIYDIITAGIEKKLENIEYNCEILVDVANFIDNLAQVYLVQGRYDEAQKCYTQALQIKEKVFGTNHIATAVTYNNIANLYRKLGNYEAALKYIRKALYIRELKLGTENIETAMTYNSFAVLYSVQGYNEEALKYFLKDLKIREKVLGIDNLDIATTYNNLAGVYQDMGKYEDTLKYYNMALEIRERICGRLHPDTAATYSNLAGVYKDLGKYKQALQYYKNALDISETILGTYNLDTATIYNNLGGMYQNQKNYKEALKYCIKALEICEEVVGTDNPYTATVCNNIGTLYYNMNNYEEALKYLRKAVDILESVLKNGHHPYIVSAKENLRCVEQEAKRLGTC